tara:strand:- start:718 stop:918 length:201 start_codon:yes stop_codon:yes gene_type:complete
MAKQTISIGKKIHAIIMTLFSVLFILTSFTDILEYNPLIEAGFWVANLGWAVSMYFDGKSKKNKDS